MPEVHPLRAAEAERYRAMTFPAFRHLLRLEPSVLFPGEAEERRVEPLALGVEGRGGPAGLALAALPAGGTGTDPELLSVFVAPGARRRGLAEALLLRLEGLIRERGFSRLRAVYTTSMPGARAVEGLLAKRGWRPPAPRMVIYRCSLEEARGMPWFDGARLRSGLEVFPWRELTAGDAAELRRAGAEAGWIDEELVPWRFDRHGFEPASSLGVRRGDVVVGWLINHRLDGATLRLTCGFLRRDLAAGSRLLPVIASSLRRAEEAGFRRCTLAAAASRAPVVRFILRRCAPFGGRLAETRGTVKTLNGAAGAVPHPRTSTSRGDGR